MFWPLFIGFQGLVVWLPLLLYSLDMTLTNLIIVLWWTKTHLLIILISRMPWPEGLGELFTSWGILWEVKNAWANTKSGWILVLICNRSNQLWRVGLNGSKEMMVEVNFTDVIMHAWCGPRRADIILIFSWSRWFHYQSLYLCVVLFPWPYNSCFCPTVIVLCNVDRNAIVGVTLLYGLFALPCHLSGFSDIPCVYIVVVATGDLVHNSLFH